MWLGVLLGDSIIGLYILQRKLNGRRYFRILRHHLPRLVEDVPLGQRRSTWYMHDDAPAYFAATLKHLPRLVEDVPLGQRRSTWYMHDDAPAYFAATLKHLTRR